uniref:Uncharacterized protein n=1 Tax=Anguilla anguilla TaxID=7936 RepID=A0A0E9TW13_ANGAN
MSRDLHSKHIVNMTTVRSSCCECDQYTQFCRCHEYILTCICYFVFFMCNMIRNTLYH